VIARRKTLIVRLSDHERAASGGANDDFEARVMRKGRRNLLGDVARCGAGDCARNIAAITVALVNATGLK
jgi:hypothetical protein